MRRIHFCNTVKDAHYYAIQHKGLLLSKSVHPEQCGDRIARFKAGENDLLVADWSMLTGWQVQGNDIQVTFSADFPNIPGERAKAEARVKHTRLI